MTGTFAQCRARDDAEEFVKSRGKRDGNDLSLVAHLGEKEGHGRRAEDPQRILRDRRIGVVQLVRN
jgi:hypothetical protein